MKAPKTQPQGESLVVREQRDWGRMVQDVPASEIGPNDLAYNENCHVFPTHVEGRTGSRVFSDTVLPMLPGRGGYTISRIGDLVTATVGAFQTTDIYSRYIVWADGANDEIIEYISPTQVKTRQDTDKAEQSGCYLRGRVVGCFYDKSRKIAIIHIDTRFFYSTWDINAYREIYRNSYETPLASSIKTYFHKDGDYIYCFDSGGIFKINVGADAPYYFKINSPVPDNLITAVIATNRKTFGRRYTYGCSKLIGKYTGSRVGNPDDANVPLNLIELETGTNKSNKDFKDYGEVFTEKKVGLGNETYGILTCDVAGTGINEDIGAWQAITDGTWTAEINGEGRQSFMRDFSDITSIEDVRSLIEEALQEYWLSATVALEIISTGKARFVITTGEVDGSTIAFLGATGTGTDISGVDGSGCGIRGTQAMAEIDNDSVYTETSTVGDLKPGYVRGYTSSLPQYHFTHYSVYGSLDSGVAGTDPITGLGNDPEKLVWLDDVPIMKAFTAYSSGGTSPGSVLHATKGVFAQSDIGAVVLFENGNSYDIDFLCDAGGNRVFTPTSQYAVISGNEAAQSAVIGSATVLTCMRIDDIVTLISGTRGFRATDVGKPLFWADGDVAWIAEYIDGSTVRTMDEGSKVAQGVAIDPTERRFGDVITDEQIISRMKNFLASHRFNEALPEVNVGAVVPGFLVAAQRPGNVTYYSQMAVNKKYLAGYYNPVYQFDDTPEDDIQAFCVFPDKLAIMCSRSTWIVATNNALNQKIPTAGISLAMLPTFKLVDNIGVKHIGSIRAIGVGLYTMITSEPAHRFFDGFKFSDNLADKQIMRTLEKFSIFSVSEYNEIDGLKIWGAEEQ